MRDYWEENNIEKPKQYVVCAAVRIGDVILCGARHWDSVMRTQAKAIEIDTKKLKIRDQEQGFIDQFGDFLTRTEAFDIIEKNGIQEINYDRNGHSFKLFSEGLY